jgi:hypothetical protein
MSLTPEFFDTTRGGKFLFVEPFYWTPHVETGLEVAERLSEHNEVVYVGPDALHCLTDETCRRTARIRIALTRKRRVSRYAHPRVRAYRRDEIAAIVRGLDLPDVGRFFDAAAPDLEALRFEGFDVGMGVISSLISLTRDADFDRSHHAALMLALARDSITIFRLTQELARIHGSDTIVLFNGRVAPTRAIRRASEKMGLRYIVHERGSSRGKYALFDRATSHQPAAIRRWVDDWWKVGENPEASGRAFLDRRRRSVATSWYSFTGRQEAGQVPPRDARKRVTFFTSSDDELIAIGDELPPDTPFCDQGYAIRSIGQACRDRGFEFIVRFHPNTPPKQHGLIGIANAVASQVVEPASNVDTYALMDSSDLVFTQNSTAGIEAAAAGKPVFYAGRNVFEHCRSVRRIMTNGDLASALDDDHPTDPADAIRYANFFGEHGIGYEYYQPRGFLSGTFHGRDLNAPLSAVRNAILRLKRGGT